MAEGTKTEHETPVKRRVIRLTALVPSILSLTAFILILILVISGSKPGVLENFNLLTLNTSKLGQNLIQFTPTNSKRAPSNPLDPLGIFPTPATTTPSIGTPTSDPLGAIESFFAGLLTNATSTIGSSLNEAEAQIVSSLVKALGIQEYYSFHLHKICSGNLTQILKCATYSDSLRALSQTITTIPKSLTLPGTTISIPLLNSLTSLVTYLTHTLTTLTTLLFVLHILLLPTSSLLALLSLTSIPLPSHRLIRIAALLSILSLSLHLLTSLISTIFIVVITTIINSVGEAVGVVARRGVEFVVVSWVCTGLAVGVGGYWVAVWFVEVRKLALKVRRRTGEEIGNWRGVWGEVRMDLKAD